MSKFDQKREAELRDKYNVPDGKLKYEHGKHFPKLVEETPSNKHYARHVNELRKKFQMDKLELEGSESLQPKEQEVFVKSSDKEEFKDFKLAVGTTEFNGKRYSICYLKTM
jgi:hypothetical protein